MTNDQRLKICKLFRWTNAVGNYPFTYLNEKGEPFIYTINFQDGSWIEEDAQQIVNLLDEQFLEDTATTRDNLTKLLRDIRR